MPKSMNELGLKRLSEPEPPKPGDRPLTAMIEPEKIIAEGREKVEQIKADIDSKID